MESPRTVRYADERGKNSRGVHEPGHAIGQRLSDSYARFAVSHDGVGPDHFPNVCNGSDVSAFHDHEGVASQPLVDKGPGRRIGKGQNDERFTTFVGHSGSTPTTYTREMASTLLAPSDSDKDSMLPRSVVGAASAILPTCARRAEVKIARSERSADNEPFN